MKKLFLIVLLAPVVVFAQKAPKPNTNKILSFYQDGKYKEAKEQADVTIADPKLSTDGKAWYYRGLVYATLDTIQDASLNALDPNSLKVAVESFKKADELNKKKDTEYFVMPPNSLQPLTKSFQLTQLSNYYLGKSIALYQQDEPDYEDSYAKGQLARYVFENTLSRYDNDTLTYYVQALDAFNLMKYDSTEEAVLKFIAKGGKDPQMYLVLIQAYTKQEKKDKALAFVKEAREKFPFNNDITVQELNIYLTNNDYDLAKKMVEEQVQLSPTADSYYLLGRLNEELGNAPEASKAFYKALEIDINHFDANASMADLTYKEVRQVREQRDASKDNTKRQQLYMKIEQELKESLPYWERLATLKPNDETVLYGLQSIYNDLSIYDDAKYTPKLNKLKAKMKALGMEVD